MKLMETIWPKITDFNDFNLPNCGDQDELTSLLNGLKNTSYELRLARSKINDPNDLKRVSDILIGFYAIEAVSFTLKIIHGDEDSGPYYCHSHPFVLKPGEFKYALDEFTFIPSVKLGFSEIMITDVQGNIHSLYAIHCYLSNDARRKLAQTSTSIKISENLNYLINNGLFGVSIHKGIIEMPILPPLDFIRHCKYIVEHLTEELVARVLHPKRVSYYLATWGYDLAENDLWLDE